MPLPETKITDRAQGRWKEILPALGISTKALNGKHCPCPVCGGKDRFRFDDKDGRGTWICSHCGAGNGFALLMNMKGWDFPETARQIEGIVGTDARPAPPPPEHGGQSAAEQHAAVKRLWHEAKRIAAGDPADLYLRRRLGEYPASKALKFHHAAELGQRKLPALLAAFVDVHGDLFGLQRTFLTPDGQKAIKDMPRLTMGKLPEGGAVRLARPADILGIAEGVETAMAATILHNIPCWAALNEGRLELWQPPEGIKAIVIFADNDANCVGQAAAYALAKRLNKTIEAQVLVPDDTGTDWNDILMRRLG